MSDVKPTAAKMGFIDYLSQCGYITEAQLHVPAARENDLDYLSKQTKIDQTILSMYRDQWLGLEQTDLDLSIHDDSLVTVDRVTCCKFIILPYLIEDGVLYIACKNPFNMHMRKAVSHQVSKKLKPKFCLARDSIILPLLHAVSYTHLTLPTNRIV